MPQTHHIYLIPGFFGFVNFGRLVYFSHVREFLERSLEHRGLRVEIHRARVPPTGSIRKRAGELLSFVTETSGNGPIHLIGHSTGGLDARLLVSPSADLGTSELMAVARRVRSVVTVSTPHHGTPLASFFTGLLGQQLLRLLSLGTVTFLRRGRLPLSLLTRMGAMLARLRTTGSKTEALFAHLYAELLGELPADERELVADFFHHISTDQSLLPQLTPEGIELFNATAADRPGVRYGCVVSCARPPSLRRQLGLGAYVDRQSTYALYRLLHSRTSLLLPQHLPRLEPAHALGLSRFLGRTPEAADNDGVVPTRSQVRGELIYAAEADHLDLIGHFDGGKHAPQHRDWIFTGSRFDRAGFERLWNAVSDFVAERSASASTPLEQPASMVGIRSR